MKELVGTGAESRAVFLTCDCTAAFPYIVITFSRCGEHMTMTPVGMSLGRKTSTEDGGEGRVDVETSPPNVAEPGYSQSKQ